MSKPRQCQARQMEREIWDVPESCLPTCREQATHVVAGYWLCQEHEQRSMKIANVIRPRTDVQPPLIMRPSQAFSAAVVVVCAVLALALIFAMWLFAL